MSSSEAQVDEVGRIRQMLARDRAAAALGVDVARADRDGVVLSLSVRDDMVNPGGICHGGVLFLLGDTALGLAVSKAGRLVVTTSATITYVSPARVGDTLHAHARPIHDSGRSGVVDVEIRTSAGPLIALVRGHVLRPVTS